MLKKISWGILLILIALCLYYWNWLSYGYNQAKGQLKVITQSRPIEDFLQDPNFPDSLKQKLELTMAVRGFAVDSLGLNKSDNYTELYDQKGKTLLWNVSASEPYALKAYTWQYPFLGEMPYKGFDLEKAKKEADLLKEKGFDVRIRTVGGWSTLGILKDPLLSNMLERNDGALAEVIIHELTHATLFVKNEVEFNENLASFIGEKGAERFLVSHLWGQFGSSISSTSSPWPTQKPLPESSLREQKDSTACMGVYRFAEHPHSKIRSKIIAFSILLMISKTEHSTIPDTKTSLMTYCQTMHTSWHTGVITIRKIPFKPYFINMMTTSN